MADRPVWEETWSYYDPHGFAGFFAKHVDSDHHGTFFEATAGEPGDEARARLAAAAPELVRVLLAVEFIKDGFCPSCHCYDGHAKGCALDAALRKAGVR